MKLDDLSITIPAPKKAVFHYPAENNYFATAKSNGTEFVPSIVTLINTSCVSIHDRLFTNNNVEPLK